MRDEKHIVEVRLSVSQVCLIREGLEARRKEAHVALPHRDGVEAECEKLRRVLGRLADKAILREARKELPDKVALS